MNLVDALVVFAVTTGATAAAIVEIMLTLRKNPRAFFYGWACWFGVVAIGMTYLLWRDGHPLMEALGSATAIGVAAYPLFRAAIALHMLRYDDPEEDARERERIRYHAMDFGGVRAAEPAPSAVRTPRLDARAPVDGPMVTLPATSKLAQVSAQRRPRWAENAELLLLGLVMVAGAVGYGSLQFGWRPGPETVVEGLEAQGYANPQVRRQFFSIRCGGRSRAAYSWSAMGARGQACASWDNPARITVDQSWPSRRVSAPGPQ